MLTHSQYIWDWEEIERERDIILNQDAEWQAPLLHLAQVSTRPFSSRSLLHVYSPKFAATCPDWTNEWILRQTVHGYRGTMRNLNLWNLVDLAPRILWHLQCSLLWLSLPYRLRVYCAAWLEWRHICTHGAQVRRVKLIQPRFGTNSKSGELFFFTYDHQHPGLHSNRFHNPTSGIVEPHRSKCGSTLS